MNRLPPVTSISTILVTVTSPIRHFICRIPLRGLQEISQGMRPGASTPVVSVLLVSTKTINDNVDYDWSSPLCFPYGDGKTRGNGSRRGLRRAGRPGAPRNTQPIGWTRPAGHRAGGAVRYLAAGGVAPYPGSGARRSRHPAPHRPRQPLPARYRAHPPGLAVDQPLQPLLAGAVRHLGDVA